MGGKHGKDGRGRKDHGSNRNDRVVDVRLDYELGDNCPAPAACVLSVAPQASDRPRGRDKRSPDWTIVDAHHVQFVADDDSRGPDESYTLNLTCTDAAGNMTVKTATVVIPDHR